jgi:undecaprenyl-diphosphatase
MPTLVPNVAPSVAHLAAAVSLLAYGWAMTNAFDSGVTAWLAQVWLHGPRIDRLAADLTGNDLIKGGPMVAALWWFWFKPNPEQARRRQVVVATVLSALLAAALSRWIANVFPFRQRPFAAPGISSPVPLQALWEAKDGSFPSDHASLAFALVAGVTLLWRPGGLTMAVYVAVFVALPRAFLGMHWATDLVGGAVLGITTTLILTRPRVRTMLAGPALRWEAASPAWFYCGMFIVMFGLMTRFDSLRRILFWIRLFAV